MQHMRKSLVLTRVRWNLSMDTMRLLRQKSQLEKPFFHNKLHEIARNVPKSPDFIGFCLILP